MHLLCHDLIRLLLLLLKDGCLLLLGFLVTFPRRLQFFQPPPFFPRQFRRCFPLRQ